MSGHFPADAFAGTAEHYLRYRPAYPDALINDLLARAEVGAKGRVLDLACGPGRVALALAPRVGEVWGVDFEPEMIAVAEREAARLGATNTKWSVGRAEEVAAEPESIGLVTMGAAFHRLEQSTILAKTREWLRPGGGVALIGSDEMFMVKEPWHEVVIDLIGRWRERMAMPGPAMAAMPAGGPIDHAERMLRERGFAEVASYAFTVPTTWTCESIAGYFRSTSVCSVHALGEVGQEFEAELRAALLAYDPSGCYREELRFGYTWGRKSPGV